MPPATDVRSPDIIQGASNRELRKSGQNVPPGAGVPGVRPIQWRALPGGIACRGHAGLAARRGALASANRRQQLLGRRGLEQIGGGPGLSHPVGGSRVVEHRQRDDPNLRQFLLDLARGLVARHDRHRDVHHDHVGLELVRHFDRLLSVARLPDDLDVLLLDQHGFEPLADDLVVVHEQDPQAGLAFPLVSLALGRRLGGRRLAGPLRFRHRRGRGVQDFDEEHAAFALAALDLHDAAEQFDAFLDAPKAEPAFVEVVRVESLTPCRRRTARRIPADAATAAGPP